MTLSYLNPQEIHWYVLLALCRSPWATRVKSPDESCLALADVQAACESLLGLGAVQQASVICSGRTHVLYAPLPAGIARGAAYLGLSPESFATRTLHSAPRFWALRGCQDAVRSTYLLCAHLLRSRRKQCEQVTWDLFVPRQYKAELFFHARINITPILNIPSVTSSSPSEQPQEAETLAVYLLMDSGEHSVWVWWRHLRYLQSWSRQADERFPPLLFVSPLTQRALSFASLARQLAPAIQVMVTGDRDVALSAGPEQARWFIVVPGEGAGDPLRAESCKPFEADCQIAGRLSGSKHRVKSLDGLMSSKSSLAPKRARKAASASMTLMPANAPANTSLMDGTNVAPVWLVGVDRMDQLAPGARRVLGFLCHHSACPLSALMIFLDSTQKQLLPILEHLCAQQLAERIQADELRSTKDERQRGELGDSFFSATEIGARLHFLRQGAPSVDRLVRRYRVGHNDHVRRLTHTAGIYDFFERLHGHAQGWSRVTLKVDVPADGYNDGDLAAYELEEFEEDVASSAVFLTHGVKRHWMPDAYGVLRQGWNRKSFWLEMDGSSAGRAHNETDRWEGKLGAMCGYHATKKWMLRHRSFPMLLIVTTDLRITRVVRDVYAHIAAAQQIPNLPVYLTSRGALAEQGPLASIWLKVHHLGDDMRYHAFEPLIKTTRN